VTSITSTETGLEINYMIGEETMSVTMTSEDCFPNPAPYINCDKGGAYLWSMTSDDPMDFDSGDEFQHMEAQQLLANGHRSIYLFGVNPDKLPSGSATYVGRFRADAYKTTSTGNEQRVRYQGRMLLNANFDMSELQGRIHAIRGSQPGQSRSSEREPWPTSYFTISDGRIANGQFTAVLTGYDNDTDTPFNESVRGYTGHILGEFFGPNAEEAGAVVSASRNVDGEDHDYVLYGFVGGDRFYPDRMIGTAAINTGSQRKYEENTTKLLEEYGTATVERTAAGWRIHVDSRTLEMRDLEDYASMFDGYYTRDVDGGRAWFWSATDWRFRGLPEFEHFSVKGWSFEVRENPGDDTKNKEDKRWLVHGNRTSASALPSSVNAIYEGRMRAVEASSDEALESHTRLATWFNGEARLEVDFATSRIDGSFSALERQTGSSGALASVVGGATFNAMVDGEIFTAGNLAGTGALSGYENGSVKGAFFGPMAEEAAGVFGMTNLSANRVLYGWFGTQQ